MPKTQTCDTATRRSLRLRRRPDIVAVRQHYRRRAYWVLKDPVSLRYVQLNEHEYWIWQRLDRRVSLEDIKDGFERRFAPLLLSYQQIQGFLGELHQKNLVLADAPGQADALLRRGRRRRGQQLLGSLTGVLALRLPGINPDTFLNRLYPICRPLLGRRALAVSGLLALIATTLVAVQFDVLKSRLPDFQAFFGATNLVWIALVLAATKILHELGHGLVCKHYGGPCHELGVMFLVFVPCLYCNVSGAWMLPNKWHRIAITAAGVWVEITLAAICTLLWWFSEPGLLNTLCLNAMFVCSVNTVLFNGNPLLRYDGYFILADLLEMPNLWQESRDYLRGLARRWCFGVEQYADLAWRGTRRAWLVLYGVASTLYRWVVLAGIIFFLFGILKPYRLEVFAYGILTIVTVGILATPAVEGWRFMRSPLNRRKIRKGPLLLSCLAVAAAATALCCIPIPFRVRAPLVLQPAGAHRVYVSVDGRLSALHVEAGQPVTAGDRLATLENLELAGEIARLQGQWREQQTRLENLKAQRSTDPNASLQIPTAEKMLDDLRQRLAQNQEEQAKLTLTAPASGFVLPPPEVPADRSTGGKLRMWVGTPLDESNLGCLLRTGTLFCLIGDPHRLEAVVYVDQSDVPFVRKGQHVHMQLDALPGQVLEGTIVELAQQDARVAPRELAVADLPVRVGPDGVARPVSAAYQARVALESTDIRLPIASRGQAKILGQPQTLGRRLYRYLGRTFTFQL